MTTVITTDRDMSALTTLARRAPATDNLLELAAWLQANGAHHLSPIERVELAEHLITRRRFLIGAAALGMGMVAGCSAPSASAPTAAVASTRLFKHGAGETEIPAQPQRIVATYTYAWAWPIVQLGGQLIGTDAQPEWIDAIRRIDPESAAKIEQATFIGSESGPNLEKIASLKPDLIVGGWWETELYDTYSQIAPTVLIDYRNEPDLITWQRSLLTLLGTLENAWFDERVAAYEQRISTLKANYPDLWPNLQWVRMDAYERDVYVIFDIPMLPGCKALTDLGTHQSKTLGTDPDHPQFAGTVSLELLPTFDADVIFLCETTAQPDPTVLSVLQGTFAGARDQVFSTRSSLWNFANVQALHAVLDEIERLVIGRAIDTSGDFR